MAVSQETVMAIKSYQTQVELLLKNILLANPITPYTSILVGILACKACYDLSKVISTSYFKCWAILTKTQRVEWNERGISTIHALYITAMSLYFVFWSDLFSDQQLSGPVTFRSSPLSTFVLGMSAGYFLSDLAMITWLYPSLGGLEYVIHHSISIIAVTYCMFMGEGQVYTYMVLISEVTTPGINMRWYLDIAGMKKSTAYIINGIMIFLSWLAARILLFLYVFYHIYMHHEQVMKMHPFSVLIAIVVPSVLAMMNLIWFWKILKGLKKTLAKRQREILPCLQVSVNDRDK